MNILKELRTSKGLYQKDLAQYLGIDRTTYVKYERGDSEPNFEMIQKLADFFNVSVDYLIGREKTVTSNIKNVIHLKTKKVPLLGDIACGEPIFTNEEHGEFVLTSEDISVDFCLRAKGDSMIGARILDGDIVFIKEQTSVDNGQIAAVLIGDEATLKRVYYYPDKNKLVLGAENPAYEPFVYVGEELEEVKILGRAVAFQSVVR